LPETLSLVLVDAEGTSPRLNMAVNPKPSFSLCWYQTNSLNSHLGFTFVQSQKKINPKKNNNQHYCQSKKFFELSAAKKKPL
jgi:hypothetical protein